MRVPQRGSTNQTRELVPPDPPSSSPSIASSARPARKTDRIARSASMSAAVAKSAGPFRIRSRPTPDIVRTTARPARTASTASSASVFGIGAPWCRGAAPLLDRSCRIAGSPARSPRDVAGERLHRAPRGLGGIGVPHLLVDDLDLDLDVAAVPGRVDQCSPAPSRTCRPQVARGAGRCAPAGARTTGPVMHRISGTPGPSFPLFRGTSTTGRGGADEPDGRGLRSGDTGRVHAIGIPPRRPRGLGWTA